MEAVKIGQLITEPQQRDAIHVAIAPVVAKEKLFPGQDCGLGGTAKEPIGIVDPFLTKPVQPEQGFWLFLYPNTITSLRHDWTHPAFAEPKLDKAESQKWMDEFASKHYSHSDEYYSGKGGTYTANELIEHARDFLTTGDRHVQQGSQSLRDSTVASEFWKHFEVITGTKVADYHRDEVPFCCTC